MSTTVKNLYAKDLLVGDVLLEVKPVESRFGMINRFTVSRSSADGLRALAQALVREAIALEDAEAIKLPKLPDGVNS